MPTELRIGDILAVVPARAVLDLAVTELGGQGGRRAGRRRLRRCGRWSASRWTGLVHGELMH